MATQDFTTHPGLYYPPRTLLPTQDFTTHPGIYFIAIIYYYKDMVYNFFLLNLYINKYNTSYNSYNMNLIIIYLNK